MVVIAVMLVVGFALCDLASTRGPDYRGTEFIVGFMENVEAKTPVELFVTTMRTSVVNVYVSSPRSNLPVTLQNFTVTAGNVTHLYFDVDYRMTGTAIGSKAILVTADDEIVLYGLNKEYASADAYLALPTDVLGTEYYAVTYTPNEDSTTASEIMIIGVKDATTVSITLPEIIGSHTTTFAGNAYGRGDTFNVSLNRFDTFQFQSFGDLTGTYIRSNLPVAILSGNKCIIMSFGACDHLVEMMAPIDTWGKSFVTVPIPRRTVGDKFRFIASEGNTTVTIRGVYNTTFNLQKAGDMVQLLIPSTAYCFVSSTKAIMVVQFVRGRYGSNDEGDPSMLTVQPVGGYGSAFTFTTPTRTIGPYTNYFAIIIKDKNKNGLRIDDQHISTTFHHIPGTDYVGGYIPITDGAHTVRHDSPIVLFAGYLYGTGYFETYAFPIGMRLAPINTVCVPTPTVVGDGLDNDCDGLIDEELCTVANRKTDDDKDGRVDEDCATPSPIDGGWSIWGSWSYCSQTCKPAVTYQTGLRTRRRPCTNPRPQYDGKQCHGNGTEYMTCVSTDTCPEFVDINSTFSCIVGSCTNITVPGGPDITVKVNLSCGSLELSTYLPNSGGFYMYQSSHVTYISGPSTEYFHFRDLDARTAFISFQNQHDKLNCTVELTSLNGSQHEIECRKDGVSVKCEEECKDQWNFPNPCKKNIAEAKDKDFAHPSDTSKFLRCDLSGNVYIVTCPKNELFSETCQQCSKTNKTCNIGSRTPLSSTHSNPCTVPNLMAGNFFFSSADDNTKFIHCDVWGKAWLMSCPYGEVWDQAALSCRQRTTTTTTTTTTPLRVSVPLSGTGYACCPTCALHTAPCTSANIAALKLLHPIRGDRHHYIQCDVTGRMYCPMPCNPAVGGGLDFFDSLTSTCVDGSLAIGNILG